jgi:hypothetical protein
LLVWVLAGLYLGRDLAILCHYAPLLILVCWAAAAAVLFKPASIARFGAAHGLLSALLSTVVGTMLLLAAFLMTRERVSRPKRG